MIILLAATLIVAFFLCISSFILGVKIGFQLKNNESPTLDIHPLKSAIKTVETITDTISHHKQETAVKHDLEEIENMSRDTMLKAIREGNQ